MDLSIALEIDFSRKNKLKNKICHFNFFLKMVDFQEAVTYICINPQNNKDMQFQNLFFLCGLNIFTKCCFLLIDKRVFLWLFQFKLPVKMAKLCKILDLFGFSYWYYYSYNWTTLCTSCLGRIHYKDLVIFLYIQVQSLLLQLGII